MTDALKAGRYELWRSYCEMFASTVCRVSGPPGLPLGYHFPSKELASKCLRVETPCKYLGSDPFCNPRVYSAPNAPQRSGSSDGVSKLRPQRGCQDTCVSLAAFIRQRCERGRRCSSRLVGSPRLETSSPIPCVGDPRRGSHQHLAATAIAVQPQSLNPFLARLCD